MAAVEPGELPDELDDRLALLFVACDEELAPGAQMVLALRVVCGLTIAETAMHLGIQESAAAARLTRAKKALAAGARGVPRARRRRAARPAAGRARLRRRHVHRRPPHRARAAATRWPTSARQALSIADALVAVVPRGHRGARAAGRRPAGAGAAPAPGRRRRGGAHPRRGRPLAVGPRAAARRARRRGVRRVGRRPVRARGRDLRACTASRRRSRRPTGRGSCSSTRRSSGCGPPPPSGSPLLAAQAQVRCPRAATWPASRPSSRSAGGRGAGVRPEGRGVRPRRPVLAHRPARRGRGRRATGLAGDARAPRGRARVLRERAARQRPSARIGPPGRP